MIVDELVAILGYDIRGEEKIGRFTAGIEKAAAAAIRFGAIAATAAATGAALFGRSIIQTSAQFEGFEASLTTIEGSAEKARSSLDWISDFARTTPYEVAGITEAFIKLKTYGIDPLADDALKTLGDTASAMNKPLNQAVEALADATTFQFERLREFGLVASQAGDKVTFTWQQNGKQMTKVVRKNGEEIRKFILDNLGDRFNGAMLRQSKTWDGMMSNLGDSWTDFQRRIGEGGFFDAVKNRLAALLDLIGQLDADGTLDRWSQNLASAFTWASDSIASVAVRIGRHITTITDLINGNQEAWKVLQAVLLGLAIGFFPVSAALVAVGLAIDDFLTYLRGGESVIGSFIEWLGQMRDALTQWLTELPGKIKSGIENAFQAGFDAAKGVVNDFVAWANEKLSQLNPLNWVPEVPGASSHIQSGGGAPRAANQNDAGLTSDALDYKTMLQNLEGNRVRMGSSGAATAVVNDNKQDNRNQATTVNVGGVTVQGVPNAGPAVGAAVGRAVGNAAAGAARVSRFEKDDAF